MRERALPIDATNPVEAVGSRRGASCRELSRWDLGVWNEVAWRFRPRLRLSFAGRESPTAAALVSQAPPREPGDGSRRHAAEWLALALSMIGGVVAVLAALELGAPRWALLGLAMLTGLVGLAGWPRSLPGRSQR